jgi:hypothetical protein
LNKGGAVLNVCIDAFTQYNGSATDIALRAKNSTLSFGSLPRFGFLRPVNKKKKNRPVTYKWEAANTTLRSFDEDMMGFACQLLMNENMLSIGYFLTLDEFENGLKIVQK